MTSPGRLCWRMYAPRPLCAAEMGGRIWWYPLCDLRPIIQAMIWIRAELYICWQEFIQNSMCGGWNVTIPRRVFVRAPPERTDGDLRWAIYRLWFKRNSVEKMRFLREKWAKKCKNRRKWMCFWWKLVVLVKMSGDWDKKQWVLEEIVSFRQNWGRSRLYIGGDRRDRGYI